MFMDSSEARRGGGSSSSSSSRSFGGGSRTTRTTTRRTSVSPTWRPTGGVLIIGYNSHYGYYYDGHGTYMGGGAPMNPVAAIIIVVIVVAVCILFCVISAKNNLGDDDIYEETVTETVTYHDSPAPYKQVYAQGTNPPGTALCNAGHIFDFMTTTPYPEDPAGAICDNCQKNVNWAMGGFHCSACEADLCQNCG